MGGRIGETPPTTSVRLFNDSGRLRNHLVLRPRKSSRGSAVLTLNVPGNRFDPRPESGWSGGTAAMEAMYQRLVALAPSVGGKLTGASARKVNRATQDVLSGMVATNERKLARLRANRNRALLSLARALGGFV